MQTLQKLSAKLIFIICGSTLLSSAQRFGKRSNYEVRVDQFNFTVNDEELISSHSVQLEQSFNRTYISGHLIVSRRLANLMVGTTLDIDRPGLSRMRLFDVQLNLCSLFDGLASGSNKNKFIKQFALNYAAFINAPLRCPLYENFNYTLTCGYVDDQMLPDFLPECGYRLTMQFSNKNKKAAYIETAGRFINAVSKQKLG